MVVFFLVVGVDGEGEAVHSVALFRVSWIDEQVERVNV